MPEPQHTDQDQQQFTHVSLDVPNGSTVTQTVQDSTEPTGTPQSSMQLPPVVAPPFMPPTDFQPEPAPGNEPTKSDDVRQQLTAAKKSQEIAQQKAEAALEQVREVEEQTKQSEAELAEKAEQAQKQAAQAKQEIEQATEKQKEVQKTLKQAAAESGPSVAGYKPFDFIKALNSPPRPDPSISSEPEIDKTAQKELSKELKQTKQEIKQAKDTVTAANKQVSKAQQVAEKAKKGHESILQKISQVLDSAADQATAADSQSYKAFLIIGAACLAVAVISVPFTSSFIWIVFLLVALVQLGMGTMLKKKSQ